MPENVHNHVYPATKPSPVDKHSVGSTIHPAAETLDAIKVSVRHFLHQLQCTPPDIPADPELRREFADVIASWNVSVDQEYIEGLTDTSCSIAESAYVHTTYEHQRVVAIYTACLVYADDLGHRTGNLEALKQFAQRFTRGEPQLHPVLICLTKLLGTLYDFFPRLSADAIIVSTIDATTAMYIQVVSRDDVISPFAMRYPHYMRLKSGIASAYAHFNFAKSQWGDAIGTYYLQRIGASGHRLQLYRLPFDKETLEGETDNYIYMRARTEQKPAAAILRELFEENLQSWHNVKQIASVQPGLVDICVSHMMGYGEFHFKARSRYHLHEIMDHP